MIINWKIKIGLQKKLLDKIEKVRLSISIYWKGAWIFYFGVCFSPLNVIMDLKSNDLNSNLIEYNKFEDKSEESDKTDSYVNNEFCLNNQVNLKNDLLLEKLLNEKKLVLNTFFWFKYVCFNWYCLLLIIS